MGKNKVDRKPRQDVKVERNLVYEVGEKAYLEGVIDKRILHIQPVIVKVMKMYLKGKLDKVLGSRSARVLTSKNQPAERFAIDKTLKMQFEDRAVDRDKILRYCHARNLVEKLLTMYVDDEFKIE